jgi:hypothetical protein
MDCIWRKAAETIFAAIFQDSRRGKLFGYRTAGGGGSVVGCGSAPPRSTSIS